MKNSLLSSAVQDNTLYDLDKDTVYSFFAEESEIRPRAKQQLFAGKEKRKSRKDKQDEEETSFIASQSPKNRVTRNGQDQMREEDDIADDALAKT